MNMELVWRQQANKMGVKFDLLHIYQKEYTVTVRRFPNLTGIGNHAVIEVREITRAEPTDWRSIIHREEHRNTGTVFLEQRAAMLLRQFASKPPAKSRRKVRCA